ncbi:hypothetical protein PAERUG_P40_Scotland_4_VIM_2_09_12_04254 [Pseudomonas aeruginosa]|nr:hypothetical protein [Pseudomonas aeruginosa]CRN71577.1 hypothetical protein PAERUG_P40_Scotland_4_VIM_2_09_12_04254 [Pseudomonas aeruginosa]
MRRSLLGMAVILLMSSQAWGADDECALDEVMRNQRVQMDQRVADIYKLPEAAMDNAPHVKDASCLPIMDDLDKLIRMRIPSIGGMDGIWTKIKDQACKMANNYLQQIANRAKTSVSDPLGVVTVSAGTTTGEGGMAVETYDFGKVLERAGTQVINQGGNVIKGDVNGAIRDLPVGPSNRTPRVESEVSNGVSDAIRGL